MDNGKFSGLNIRDKFRGKDLGSVFSSQVKKNLGASGVMSAKEKLAKELAAKSFRQRKSAYEDLDISRSGVKKLESAIVGQRGPTLMEKERMKEDLLKRQRRNIFASRRSSEEGNGASSFGLMGAGSKQKKAADSGKSNYEEYHFAGGGGTIRTREDFKSADAGPNTGFASRPTGGGGSLSRPGSGGGRPLGF